MLKLRRKRKDDVEAVPPLALPAVDGTAARVFATDLVESLRHMITRLTRTEPLPPRVALTAALREEGVTTISEALATTIAHDLGARVCIVDLNWWWSAASPLVAADNAGLAAVLKEEATLDDVIAPTGWSNLAYVPAGELPQHQRPVTARSPELKQILAALEQRFDHLLLDVPAILATNDAVPLVSLAPACCLVVRQGVTSVENVQRALREIDHLTLLGVVLNQARLATPRPLLHLIPAQ